MRTKPSEELRNRLLRQFPADRTTLLIEFNKYLSQIDADYIIIMARKALRIHDLLLMAGGRLPSRPIVSHHVLDQDLAIFKGKRIALVDDTLILGTTLGEARRKLERAGASVTCTVFAVDTTNWCHDLVEPEKVFLQFDNQEAKSFCAMEVSALAAAGIPYLSDFPVSNRFRLSKNALLILHSLAHWDTHALATSQRNGDDAFTYSLLPKDGEALLTSLFGKQLAGLIEIAKVRAFCIQLNGSYWFRFVPIATLKPLRFEDVNALFKHVVALVEGKRRGKLNNLAHHLKHATSKLRLVQYVMSLGLGANCFSELASALQSTQATTFNLQEGTRLFGPWLQAELQYIHATVPIIFARHAVSPREARGLSDPANLPDSVIKATHEEFREFAGEIEEDSEGDLPRSHFMTLVRAFIGRYRRHELPARDEARRLKGKLFDASADEAPFRDRLKTGFAWPALVECLLAYENLNLRARRLNRFSLLLDHLIDVGVAVPILCEREGILFRAYRHGEDVEFGDQEIALIHAMAQAFLAASKRTEIPRLFVEKMIASLLHVGVAKGFLNIWHGSSGEEGFARIGFHLHGAVPMTPRRDTIFADEQDTWISRYLLRQRVLRQAPNSTMYTLGIRPSAAFVDDTSVYEAQALGRLLGSLSVAKWSDGRAVLSENNAAVLASCIQPRYVAGAVAAEVRLLSRMFEFGFGTMLNEIDWNNVASISEARTRLVRNGSYLAGNSARMKLVAARDGGSRNVIQACAEYLQSQENGDMLAGHWLACWKPVLRGADAAQAEKFSPLIAQCTDYLLSAMLGVFAIELALTAAEQGLSEKTSPLHNQTCQKVTSYLNALSPLATLDSEEKERLAQLKNRAGGHPISDPRKVLAEGVEWLQDRRALLHSFARNVEAEVLEYGRLHQRSDYVSVLWYDIIDSRGLKSELTGDALRQYRDRVEKFKVALSDECIQFMRDVGRRENVFYPWRGQIGSKDDEMHLFFGGLRNLSLLPKVARVLFQTAKTYRICVRAVAIRADFAGTPAHKYERESQVLSAPFWEHFAGVKSGVRNWELALNANPLGQYPRRSLFWNAGDLIGKLNLPNNIVSPVHTKDCITNIDGIEISTRFIGGTTGWPPG